MKKIFDYIAQCGKDKVLHFTISLLISITAACMIKVCGGDKYAVLAGAWFAGFAAGIGKEIYDEWKYKGADEKDWAADVLGTTLGTVISIVIAL